MELLLLIKITVWLIITSSGIFSDTELKITMTSSFPNSPMLISLVVPENITEEISKYLLWIKDPFDDECLLWMVLHCSHCSDEIFNDSRTGDFLENCTKISTENIFNINQTLISVSITSPLIRPYQWYGIFVTPINTTVWYNSSSLIQRTAEYISDPVTDLTLSSHFPHTPLMINWIIPVNSNGEIVQYIIYVKDSTENKCIIWTDNKCNDCYNKIIGENGSENLTTYCTSRKDIDEIFSRNQTAFTLIMMHNEIKPYTSYQVFVLPINGYGWGIRNNESVVTGEFVSDSVRNLSLASNFLDSPLTVSWLKPQNPNGLVIKYIIIVRNNDNNKTCLIWWSIDCEDCVHKTTENTALDPSIIECLNIKDQGTYFRSDGVLSTVSNNSALLPYTEYVIEVIPVNGFAYGERSSKLIRTSEYKSGPVSNLTVTSHFPRDNLIINWGPPQYPQGKIISYYVFVFKEFTDFCIGFINISVHTINKIEFQSSNSLGYPSMNNVSYFNKDNQSFTVYITDEVIQPDHNLTITVTPINGYGFGFNDSQYIQTISYKPSKVSAFTSTIVESDIMIWWSIPLEDIFNYTYKLNITQKNTIVNTIFTFSQSTTKFIFQSKNFCTIFDICIRTSTPYGEGEVLCLQNVTDPSFVTTQNLYLNPVKNSIIVSWTSVGESNCLVEYSIYYRDNEIITTAHRVSILDLKYYTEYNVTVTPCSRTEVTSPGRIGRSEHSVIRTEIGKPEKVQDFSCTNITFNEFRCSWKRPKEINGPSVSYYLKCYGGKTFQTISLLGLYAFISEEVVPEINYTCHVEAKTITGSSELSFTYIQIAASEAADVIYAEIIPDVMASSTKDSTTSEVSVILPYSHFTEKHGRITKFTLVIVTSNKGGTTHSLNKPLEKTYSDCQKGFTCPYEITLTFPVTRLSERNKRFTNVQVWSNENYIIGSGTDCDKQTDKNCNGPLGSNTEYTIGFRAYTVNGFITVGFIKKSTKYDPVAVSVSLTIVFVVVSIVILGLILYRYRHKIRYSKEVMTSTSDETTKNYCPKLKNFKDYYNNLINNCGEIAVKQFLDLNQKWKQLENERKLIYIDGNEMKNRFKNIKPYEHNNIRLKDPDDYINASRICVKHLFNEIDQPCECNSIFIATQGPLKNGIENKLSTIGDFWRMAFQYDIQIIVNLTKCVESYKEKCAQYWPEEIDRTETYISGDQKIEVKLQNKTSNGAFEERTFKMKMDNIEKSIIQLHFTDWTDHGCPEVNSFIDFYTRFHSLRKDGDSVIVHCSAGVGRTGTFILIDIQLQNINSHSSRINIYETLLSLRRTRCLMVQTEKQYIFVHEIIYEYLKRKDINFDKKKLSKQKNVESRYSYSNPAFECQFQSK